VLIISYNNFVLYYLQETILNLALKELTEKKEENLGANQW